MTDGNTNRIIIRPATAQDLAPLVQLRRAMFEAMGFNDPQRLDAVDLACRDYFTRALAAGTYQGWLAVTISGEVVASGGVVVDRHPPGPELPDGRLAYIMNMYTVPAHRRQGLARSIFAHIMTWVRQEGIALASLHATAPGRPLYAEFGFEQSNEMLAHLPNPHFT